MKKQGVGIPVLYNLPLNTPEFSEMSNMHFRPTKPNQFIGNDDPESPLFYLDEWERDSPQCLLFSGAPGLGKTTAAYIIADYLGLKVEEFNASDERGIDVVRNRIKQVAMTASPWETVMILLDEAEGLTKQAQDALKRTMEVSKVWWILTCNDDSAIIPAIKSRCVHFRFKPYTAKQTRAYAELLLTETGAICSDDPDALHSHFAGDLRAIGNHILSGRTLAQNQTNFDSIALDVAAGEWESVHRKMLQMVDDGFSLHRLMQRIHEHVRSVGLEAEQLYAFFVVWGDFVLRMHTWPLGVSAFVDYFVAALYREDNTKEE